MPCLAVTALSWAQDFGQHVSSGALERCREGLQAWEKERLGERHQVNPHELPSLAEAVTKAVMRLAKTCNIKPKTLLDFVSSGCSALQH